MKRLGMVLALSSLGLGSLALLPSNRTGNNSFATMPQKSKAKEVDNVVFSEGFDDEITEAYGSNFELVDGKGLVTANNYFSIPFTGTESNNYEISFDLQYSPEKTGDIYIHLEGLDGDGGNVYLGVEGNGAYWFFRTQKEPSGEVYNNGGDFYGGLNYESVDLNKPAHVQIIHYEGYIELIVNGIRRAVAHLSAFGGTQYQAYNRINVPEGKITGLGIDAKAPSTFLFDNLTIKEAQGRDVNYQFENKDKIGRYILPLNAQDLYHDNYQLQVDLTLNDDTLTGKFPSIRFFGLNGSLFGHNIQSGFNFQFFEDNKYLTPQLFTHESTTVNDGEGWRSVSSETALELKAGDTITYTIEVAGDDIKTYVDDTLSFKTSFTELSVPKGHLQYILFDFGDSGYSWSNVKFANYAAASGASISSEKLNYTSGSTATIHATKFGDRTQTYQWYVNDVAQAEESDTLVLENLESGTYTIQYKNNDYQSNILTLVVSDGILTLTSEETEGYTTDTFTLTLEKEGDFSGLTNEWYLDEVKLEETGDTLTLSNLEIGDHVVYAKAGKITSNVLTITINKPTLKITSEKSAYNNDDTAIVEASLFGYPEDTPVDWYIDGVMVDDNKTPTLLVDMSKYTKGQQIIVKAGIGETFSNDFVLTIYYNIASELTSDESYKVFSEMEIKEGNTYGTFLVGSDETGNYLYADPNTVNPYCPIEGTLPQKNAYTFEYKLWIPEELPSHYYVYPCLIGANSKYPNASIEVAFDVSEEGMRPYVKDQGSSTNYDDDSGAVIADYTYETGCAKKGDWNHVVFAVQNKSIAVTLNDTPVLFFTLPSITVPTGLSMNWWSDLEGKNIPFKFKEVKVGGLTDPIPDLESINLSVSSLQCKVNETVTINAVINPFNAVAETFEWYVNDELVSGQNTKTLSFTPSKAGEYKIYCKVGNITSEIKTIKVESNSGNTNNGWIIATSIIVPVVVLAGAIVGVFVYKKKKR